MELRDYVGYHTLFVSKAETRLPASTPEIKL